MAIDRTNYNALVNDDGSNTVGSLIDKLALKNVLLDPIDAAIVAGDGVESAARIAADAAEVTARNAAIAAAIVAAYTWTAVPYAAGDFTSDVGTWVVDAGDVINFKYRLNGKTMTVAFESQTTTVTGTPTVLNVKIPAGKVPANQGSYTSFLSNNGTSGNGLVQLLAGNGNIRCLLTSITPWANATNLTYVRFTIEFEIA